MRESELDSADQAGEDGFAPHVQPRTSASMVVGCKLTRLGTKLPVGYIADVSHAVAPVLVSHQYCYESLHPMQYFSANDVRALGPRCIVKPRNSRNFNY